MAEGSLYKALWRRYKGGEEGYGMTNKNQATLLNKMDADDMAEKKNKKTGKKRKKNAGDAAEAKYKSFLGR